MYREGLTLQLTYHGFRYEFYKFNVRKEPE